MENRNIKLLCFILCHLFLNEGWTQAGDSTRYFLKYSSSGAINKTNGGKTLLINNGIKFSISRRKNVLNANASWIYGNLGRKLTNNDFSSAIDFDLYNANHRFYFWGLGAFDNSYSLRVVNRFQGGAGAACYLFSTSSFSLNLSDGILYEYSDLYLADSVRDTYNTFRNSFRLTYRINIHELVVIDGQHFFQNSFADRSDYIIKSASSVSVHLSKWISLTATLAYNLINRTKSDNLLFTYGVNLEKSF